jgi:CRISPR-associated protein Cas5d
MLALKNVEYLIEADLWINTDVPASGPEDNIIKYEMMFLRRLGKGQQFHAPYLGCREFAANLQQPTGEEHPIEVDMDYGFMFYDFIYPKDKDTKTRPIFYQSRLNQGVVDVPGRDTVLAQRGFV